jgi:hypothetical protein
VSVFILLDVSNVLRLTSRVDRKRVLQNTVRFLSCDDGTKAAGKEPLLLNYGVHSYHFHLLMLCAHHFI